MEIGWNRDQAEDQLEVLAELALNKLVVLDGIPGLEDPEETVLIGLLVGVDTE